MSLVARNRKFSPGFFALIHLNRITGKQDGMASGGGAVGTGDRRLTEFLQICIDMELGLTQIYRALIGKLKLGAEIRDFCADLENAGQRTAERFQDEGLRVAAANGILPAELSLARSLKRYTGQTLQVLQEGDLTELQALRLVKGLELSFWNFHPHNALTPEPEVLKELFTAIAREKRNYIGRLSTYFLFLTAMTPFPAPAVPDNPLLPSRCGSN